MMMMSFGAFDDAIFISSIPGKPETVVASGKEMTREAAERLKDEQIRSKFGLEPIECMPVTRVDPLRLCRYCRSTSQLRCSACRTCYCSRKCQSRHWKHHLFTCCVDGRPNDVDHLRLATRKWVSGSQRKREEVLRHLFSDSHLCSTFGFNNCPDGHAVGNLICFYHNHVRQRGAAFLQRLVDDEQKLGQHLEILTEASLLQDPAAGEHCHCFHWYLQQRSNGFEVPSLDDRYAHHSKGILNFMEAFSISSSEASERLTAAEKKVARLYGTLFLDFNKIPNLLTSEWFDFGFCFCRDQVQKEALAAAYLKLAALHLPLRKVAAAWEVGALDTLMSSQGIDISFLESKNIAFRRPSAEQFPVYRFVAEVGHLFSGVYCACFRRQCDWRSKHEANLSTDSEVNYGFHATNAWERWQLLKLYSVVFAHPEFDPREMQSAKRDEDPKALKRYVERLVPDFEKQIFNKYLVSGMFPTLSAKLKYGNGQLDWGCSHIVHAASLPPGLDFSRIS